MGFAKVWRVVLCMHGRIDGSIDRRGRLSVRLSVCMHRCMYVFLYNIYILFVHVSV